MFTPLVIGRTSNQLGSRMIHAFPWAYHFNKLNPEHSMLKYSLKPEVKTYQQ